MVKTISVINFKGGVGKTTLSFHLGVHLSKSSKVLLVDVDHQSSLSIVALDASNWENTVKSGRTTNKIFESFCKKNAQMPGAEIITKEPLKTFSSHPYPNLDIVAAQFELDDTEIEMASTTMGGPTVSEWEKRTLIAQWLDKIKADELYDYIIFDCPPATKLVSQNALAASNYFVVPVIPDEMSTRGVTHFRQLVETKVDGKLEFLRKAAGISDSEVPKHYFPKTRLAGIAPFMAKPAGNADSGYTNIHTQQLSALKRQWGADVLNTVVKSLTGIPETMSAGWPVWYNQGGNVNGTVVKMMTDVCDEIQGRLK
ncbi:ParA family protein [Agrobacterium cavarae]